jgi:hypothetical protein
MKDAVGKDNVAAVGTVLEGPSGEKDGGAANDIKK